MIGDIRRRRTEQLKNKERWKSKRWKSILLCLAISDHKGKKNRKENDFLTVFIV